MYEIDPKFLNEDGSINVEAAHAAGRRARAQAAGDGYRYLFRAVRQILRASRRLPHILVEHTASVQSFWKAAT